MSSVTSDDQPELARDTRQAPHGSSFAAGRRTRQSDADREPLRDHELAGIPIPPHLAAGLDEDLGNPDPDAVDEADEAWARIEQRHHVRVLHGVLHEDLRMERLGSRVAALTAPLWGPRVGAIRGRIAGLELSTTIRVPAQRHNLRQRGASEAFDARRAPPAASERERRPASAP